MAKSYDRQEGETDQAWQAFVIYRDLGVERSQRLVASQLGISDALAARWSSQWRWLKRVSDYENDLDRAKRAAELKAVEEMRRRQIKIGMRLQEVAVKELEKYARDVEQDHKQLKPRELSRFLKEGTGLERLNRGEPSEIVQQVSESEFDYSKLSAAELKALRDIRSKMRGESDDADDV